MNLSKRVQRRLFEALDPAVDTTNYQYVWNLYSRIIDKYINRFLSTANSREELYNEYNDNNLPGGLDFILTGCVGHTGGGYTFGASASPDLDGFLDVKKGCWLNSLDFMNKYSSGFENYSLAHGIMIANSDLESAEKSLENDKIPLRIPMIMHGFIVDTEGRVFDPTLGVNEKYHYFWNKVPKDIWQGFDYKFKDEGDWEVKDFAAYTQSTIKALRGTGFNKLFPEK